MKKGCPRNTRSTPMKQNLRDKAFVAFVCLVGKPLLPKIVVGNHRPKGIADPFAIYYWSFSSIFSPSALFV